MWTDKHENWKWLAYIFLRETIRSKDHHVQGEKLHKRWIL